MTENKMITTCSETTNKESPTIEKDCLVVELKAPSALPGGYKFWATSAQGQEFPITIPEGGIEEGETLRVAVPIDDIDNKQHSFEDSISTVAPTLMSRKNGSTSKLTTKTNDDKTSKAVEAAEGHWNDGVFDLFKHGYTHPTVVKALCCSEVLMAQLLARMNLTWALQPPPGIYRTALITFVILFSIDYHTSPYTMFEFDPHSNFGFTLGNSPWWRYLMYGIPGLLISCYSFMVSVQLRKYVRDQYNIRTGRLGICEDTCLMMWIHPCVLAQMARQTMNYNNKNNKDDEGKDDNDEPESLASFCSKDGRSSTSTMKEKVDFCLLMLV